MASAYSVVREYGDYIVPINLELLAGVLSYKQQQYDTNYSKVQQELSQITNLDLARPEDQKYLQDRLKVVNQAINNAGSVDFSNNGVANAFTQGIKAAVDDNVIIGYRGTMLRKKEEADIADIKKNNPKLYNEANHTASMEAYDKWMKSGVGVEYKGSRYVNYANIDELIFNKIKDSKDFIIKSYKYQESPDGKGNPYAGLQIVTKEGKSVSQGALDAIVNSVLTENADQVAINAKYGVAQNYTPQMHMENIGKANEEHKKALDNYKALLGQTTDEKEKKMYQEAIDNITKVTAENEESAAEIQKALNIGDPEDLTNLNERVRRMYYVNELKKRTYGLFGGTISESATLSENTTATKMQTLASNERVAMIKASGTGRTKTDGTKVEDDGNLSPVNNGLIPGVVTQPAIAIDTDAKARAVYANADTSYNIFRQTLRAEWDRDQSLPEADRKAKWGTITDSWADIAARAELNISQGSQLFSPQTKLEYNNHKQIKTVLTEADKEILSVYDPYINKYIKDIKENPEEKRFIYVPQLNGKGGVVFNRRTKTDAQSVVSSTNVFSFRNGNKSYTYSGEEIAKIDLSSRIATDDSLTGSEKDKKRTIALASMITAVTKGTMGNVLNPYDSYKDNFDFVTKLLKNGGFGDFNTLLAGYLFNRGASNYASNYGAPVVQDAIASIPMQISSDKLSSINDVVVEPVLKKNMTKIFTYSNERVTHNKLGLTLSDIKENYPNDYATIKTSLLGGAGGALEEDDLKGRVIDIEKGDDGNLMASINFPNKVKEGDPQTFTLYKSPVQNLTPEFIGTINMRTGYRNLFISSLYSNSEAGKQTYKFSNKQEPKSGEKISMSSPNDMKDFYKANLTNYNAQLKAANKEEIPQAYFTALDNIFSKSIIDMKLTPAQGGWIIDYELDSKPMLRINYTNDTLHSDYTDEIDGGNKSFPTIFNKLVEQNGGGIIGLIEVVKKYVSNPTK